MELSRVLVLGSRPVEGDTVNELIESQTLLLKEYTWMARAVYECSRQDPEPPTARVVLVFFNPNNMVV
jgi:hypothetical protein